MGFDVKDYYFKKAKKENYFARSIYKLEEIDQKFNIIKTGNSVLDLGYYPGSWTQYAAKKIGNHGLVVAVDIQEINVKLLHEKNVKLFQRDVFDIQSLGDLDRSDYFDVVLSDMAPKTSGIKCVDQDRSLALVEQVIDLLPRLLKYDGHFVIKMFESGDSQMFIKNHAKKIFREFHLCRPKSTRSVSKEIFGIGKSYKFKG